MWYRGVYLLDSNILHGMAFVVGRGHWMMYKLSESKGMLYCI